MLQAIVLVPAVAAIYSLHQESRYRASADVLINSQNAAQNIAGVASNEDPQRFLDTQAALAREPEVARNVVAEVGGSSRDLFLQNSSVEEKQGANLLVFKVTDHNRARAIALAAEYARQYVAFEQGLDTRALEAARAKVRARIAALGRGAQRSVLYASLSDKEQQLETALTLQTSTASVVRVPDDASKVQPKPLRNGVLGLVLGLVLGVALAFLRDALDTRVRTAREFGAKTGLTLLARIPRPPRRLRRKDRLVMLDEPFDPHAEAFRALRTNILFSIIEAQARTILLTSAIEREGKSTTAANLAVAFARAGERTILVDLDLRRPFLHRFFDHESRPGITDVASGHVELADALFEVPVGMPDPSGGQSQASEAHPHGAGAPRPSLAVLPAGQLPPDPGEFVGTQALGQLLIDLGGRADVVIIDTPPVLRVSDALTLSMAVDAMVVVGRVDLLRRNMLVELHRVLESCAVPKLGFILTGAEHEQGGAYASYSGYYLSTAKVPERSR